MIQLKWLVSEHVVAWCITWLRISFLLKLACLTTGCLKQVSKASVHVFRFSFLADCFGGTCTSLPWSIIITHKSNEQWKQWKSAYVWEARGACQNSRFRINLPVHTNSILVPLGWLITNLLFGLKVVCSEILVMLTKVIEDYVMLYLIFVNQDRW